MSYGGVDHTERDPIVIHSGGDGGNSPMAHMRAGRFMYHNNIYVHTSAEVEAKKILQGESTSGYIYNLWSSVQDKVFVLLFLLNLAFFAKLSVSSVKQVILHGGFAQPFTDSMFNPSLFTLLLLCLGSSGGAFLISYALVWLVKTRPQSVFFLSVCIYTVSTIVFTLTLMALRHVTVLMAVFSVASIVIVIFWYFLVKDLIGAAAKITEGALTALTSTYSNMGVTFIFGLVQTVVIAVFFLSSCCILAANGMISVGGFDAEQIPAQTGYTTFLIVYLMFTFYWCTQIVKGLCFCTLSGSMASYWLMPGYVREAVVYGSLVRACVFNFGSICFGALILSIVMVLRSALRFFSREDESNFAQVCIQCILGLVEETLRYFNVYAYTYVAIYGTSYLESGKRTVELFQAKGINVLRKDDVVGLPMSLLLISTFTTVGSIILMASAYLQHISTASIIYMFCGMAIAFAISSVVLASVEASVTTAYVIWCELPQEMKEVQPDAYTLIDEGHKAF